MRFLTAFGISFFGAGTLIASGFLLPAWMPDRYETPPHTVARVADTLQEAPEPVVLDTRPSVTHVPLPESVRAVYMTACVAGTPAFRDRVISLIERTELNAVVIDIKDYSGTISFPPQDERLQTAWQEARCGARDMASFIASLHEKGIYVIGRITVFQDPLQTRMRPDLAVRKASDGDVWRDHKGLSFVDVSAREHWDYIVALAIESYAIGFDELNFDYVRFPSDGNMRDIAFVHTGTKSKPEALELFFAYLQRALSDPGKFADVRHEGTGRATSTPYLSVDLFGMVTTNTDDLNIGQVLERALPYFDFIAPMVYPSHYPSGFMGLGNPNLYPYEIVNRAMREAVRRAAATTTSVAALTHVQKGTSTPPLYSKEQYAPETLRPWLQDFDYGGDYGPKEVRTQIQAAYDAGLTGWMLWAPSNIYTEAALEPKEVHCYANSGCDEATSGPSNERR